MGLKAKAKNESSMAPVEAGTWPAVCVGYADLGTQVGDFQGKPTEARKVLVFWDIPDQRMEYDGQDKPRRISARYTLSLGKKANLRKVLEAWRGRQFTEAELEGFDLSNLIGVGCMLNVAHKARADGNGVFASVQAVMALPKSMPKPALETGSIEYLTEAENGDFVEPPDALPEWVREIVKQSIEYKTAHGIGNAKPVEGQVNSTRAPDDDDIAF
jgi:hypothetical protein